MRRLIACLLPLFAAVPACGFDADSLAYCRIRDSLTMPARPDREPVLRAAGELAAVGLFRDALGLLSELGSLPATDDAASAKATVSPGTAATESAGAGRAPAPSWRVSGGADYTHWEDLASVADTSRPETRDSLARLLENPLVIFSKAAFTWKNAAPFIRTVDPSLYVSNQKAALDLSATIEAGRLFTLEAGIRTEKRLTNTVSPATGASVPGKSPSGVFVGDREDSLDMIGGRTTVRFGSGDNEGRLRIEAPVTIEGVRYRNGRTGYYSYNNYLAAPAINFTSGDMRKSAGVRLTGEYKDYESGRGGGVTRADSFDIYRIGPELYGELWWGRLSAAGTGGYLYEQYLSRGIPYEVRSVEAESRIRAKLLPSLEVGVLSRYNNRNEGDRGELDYFKDTVRIINFMGIRDTIDTVVIRSFDAAFRLLGREAEITPMARFSITPSWTAEVRFPVTMRAFAVADSVNGKRLTAPVFILESLTAFEPEIGFDYAGGSVSGRAAAAYMTENVPERQYYTLSSSRGWKTRADCAGKLTRQCSFYVQAEYQFRRYTPYDARSRTSKNLQASSGFAFKW